MKLKFQDIRDVENYVMILHDFLCLYTTAFPPEERRSEWIDEGTISSFIEEKDDFNIIIASIDDSFVGFLSYWHFKEYIYIEHFAVEKSNRGKGIGKKILQHVIENICGNIILEVELPNSDISKRRVNFYKNEGFVLWQSIEYIQPAYSEGQAPVPLMLMTNGDMLLSSAEDEKILEIKNRVYGISL